MHVYILLFIFSPHITGFGNRANRLYLFVSFSPLPPRCLLPLELGEKANYFQGLIIDKNLQTGMTKMH